MQHGVSFNWCALGVCDPQTNRPWHSVWEHSVSFNWCALGVCDPQAYRPRHVVTQAHSTMPLPGLQNKHCTSRGAVHQQMSVSIPGTACSRNYLVNYGHKHFYTPLFRDIADHLTNTDAYAVFAVQAAGSASTCHSPSVKCWLMQAQQTLMQVHQKDSGAVVGSRQTRPPVLSFVWQHGGPDHAPVHQRHKPPLQLRISTSDH